MNVSGDILLTVIYESTTWGKHTVATIKVAVSNREEIEDQSAAGLRYLIRRLTTSVNDENEEMLISKRLFQK